MSGGTKVDFRCRLSENACNFPVCAVLNQRTLPREHTDSSQLHTFMMKFTLRHTDNKCILEIEKKSLKQFLTE